MALPHLTLRLKLTLWFLGIFAVVYVGVALGAWLVLEDAADREMNQYLQSAAIGAAEQLRRAGFVPPNDLAPFQPIDRQFVILALRDPSGAVVASSPNVDAAALPPIDSGERDDDIVLHELDGGQSQSLLGRAMESRAVTLRFNLPDQGVHYLDVARTASVDSVGRGLLLWIVCAGAAAALVASSMVAWLVAGRAVEPLRQVAAAAREVDPAHMETRVRLQSTDPEVERLQSELNDALERLERGYRAQQQFISNVAHDLKTPIAVMLTEAQVYRTDATSSDEAEAYRRSVIEEMRRLSGLVEGFLVLTRTDQSEALARRAPVELNDVVLESVRHCEPEASQFEVKLQVRLPEPDHAGAAPEVFGDADLLCTMLDNLVQNAIRHSPARAQVELSLEVSDGLGVLRVRDFGPGVAPQDIDRIFDRFVRASSERSRSGGTGLGLAIARSVAQSHGGMISVANCPDGGCRFTVTLPLYRPPQPDGTSGDREV